MSALVVIPCMMSSFAFLCITSAYVQLTGYDLKVIQEWYGMTLIYVFNMYIFGIWIGIRHLQADSWKIISAADDKTLKVKDFKLVPLPET